LLDHTAWLKNGSVNRLSTLLLLCLLLGSCEARAEDIETSKTLEGTWRFVKPSDADAQKKDNPAAMRVVFKGDTIAFVGDDSKRAARGTYKVDPGKNPKTMDIILDKDGAKLITLAIYELDGDTLRLCHYLGAMAYKERPKQFVADKRTVVGILKRVKK
jgi:uncharacterized protein (TIGR03067 family)